LGVLRHHRTRTRPTTAEEWDQAFAEDHSPSLGIAGKGVDLLSLPQNRFLAPLVRPGIRALEAGCGEGKFVFAFAKAGAFALGVDFSVRETSIVRSVLRRRKTRGATALAGDLMHIPLADDTIDLYSSFGVYEHFLRPQHDRLFAEAFRVLKPGGHVYIDVPHFWSPWSVRRQLRYWYRSVRPPRLVWQKNLSRRYLTRAAERQGFETVESHVFDAWTAFGSGFSLNQRRLKGLPNPFLIFQPAFARISRACDARGWMGFSLVYIGQKPQTH
jgi:SAM-dependent methyltransferase